MEIKLVLSAILLTIGSLIVEGKIPFALYIIAWIVLYLQFEYNFVSYTNGVIFLCIGIFLIYIYIISLIKKIYDQVKIPSSSELDPLHELRGKTPSGLAFAAIWEEFAFRGVWPLAFVNILPSWLTFSFFTVIWVVLHRRPRLFLIDLGFGMICAGFTIVFKEGIIFAVILHLWNNCHKFVKNMWRQTPT